MLGTQIRNARNAAGLTQEQVADTAGITSVYLSLVENDKRTPSIEIFVNICEAIGAKASDLLRQAGH